jgi:hypothetical protein
VTDETHPEIPADWVDMAGRQLELGDTIVAAFTMGRSAELRRGTIVGWSVNAEPYQDNRRSLKVIWDRSSSDARFEIAYPDRERTWAYGPVGSGKPTSIQYEHMKHLVIGR